MHLMLHQNVSRSSDPTLQMERNAVCKTSRRTLSPLTLLPRLDVSSGATRRWHGMFSPNQAGLICIVISLSQTFIIICIFSWYISPKRKPLLQFCCLCIPFIDAVLAECILLIKGATGDNLMDSMLPMGSVKGQIYCARLLFKALGTGIVFLWASTGIRVLDNSANLTWFYCWVESLMGQHQSNRCYDAPGFHVSPVQSRNLYRTDPSVAR